MVNFVAENVGFNDVNLRNLKIGYTKIKTSGGKETATYPFDCLCFVANGSGYASAGGKTWNDLSRGTALYVKNGEEATFVSCGDDEFEVYSVTADTYGNAKFFTEIGFSDDKRLSSLGGETTMVEDLYKTALKGTEASAYECVGKFFEIIAYFAKTSDTEEKHKTDENEYIAKAKEFIHMQYHLDINVTTVAEAVYLNRSYFSTMFKNVTGVSPLEYLIDFRIKQACKLLAMGKGVTDTAILTGFNSASAFAAHFKRKMKETPSAYRARVTSGGKNEKNQ